VEIKNLYIIYTERKLCSYLYYVENFLKETLCVAIALHSVNRDVERRKQGSHIKNIRISRRTETVLKLVSHAHFFFNCFDLLKRPCYALKSWKTEHLHCYMDLVAVLELK